MVFSFAAGRAAVRGLTAGTARQLAQAAVQQYGSISAAARQTTIPRRTLSDLVRGVTTPSQLTLGRLTDALDIGAWTERKTFQRTIQDTGGFWSDDQLANIVPPRDAVAFRIISEDTASPGRQFGSSDWIDASPSGVADYVEASGINPESIGRVVWDIRN